jgi:hypothetical protein
MYNLLMYTENGDYFLRVFIQVKRNTISKCNVQSWVGLGLINQIYCKWFLYTPYLGSQKPQILCLFSLKLHNIVHIIVHETEMPSSWF